MIQGFVTVGTPWTHILRNHPKAVPMTHSCMTSVFSELCLTLRELNWYVKPCMILLCMVCCICLHYK